MSLDPLTLYDIDIDIGFWCVLWKQATAAAAAAAAATITITITITI
jgi:hypothetical protein